MSSTSGLSLDKQAGDVVDANDNGRVDAGDTIVYTFVVTNTGTTTITGIRIDDDMLERAGVDVTCPSPTLAPGDTATCRADYTVTRADAQRDEIVNTTTASGDGHAGEVTSNESSTRLPVDSDDAVDDHGDDDPPQVIPDAGGPTVAWLGLGLGLLTVGGLLLFRFRRRSQEGTP